jgi:hypothetical protein
MFLCTGLGETVMAVAVVASTEVDPAASEIEEVDLAEGT